MFKGLKFITISLLILFAVSMAPLASAAPVNITVKQDNFFKVPLPATPKNENITYH
jgi:hypothetical protein